MFVTPSSFKSNYLIINEFIEAYNSNAKVLKSMTSRQRRTNYAKTTAKLPIFYDKIKTLSIVLVGKV